jgi:hypothetical protein
LQENDRLGIAVPELLIEIGADSVLVPMKRKGILGQSVTRTSLVRRPSNCARGG